MPSVLLFRNTLLLALLLLPCAASAGVYEILASVRANGGTTASGERYRGNFTVGQPAVGRTQGELYSAGIGFWHTFGRPTPTAVPPPAVTYRSRLGQNSPNPFNAMTEIAFEISETDHVRLRVYDLRGRLVATVVDETLDAGPHLQHFDAPGLPSGVYVYELVGPGIRTSRSMTLVK